MDYKTALLQCFAAMLDKCQNDYPDFQAMAFFAVNENGHTLMIPFPNTSGDCLPVHVIEGILCENLHQSNREELPGVKVVLNPSFGSTQN